jgi:hypothetical protein
MHLSSEVLTLSWFSASHSLVRRSNLASVGATREVETTSASRSITQCRSGLTWPATPSAHHCRQCDSSDSSRSSALKLFGDMGVTVGAQELYKAPAERSETSWSTAA